MKKQIVVCACGEPWTHPADPMASRRTADVELTRSGLTITMIKVPEHGAFQGPAYVPFCGRKKLLTVTT